MCEETKKKNELKWCNNCQRY